MSEVKSLSHVWFFVTHGLYVAYHALPSVGFSRQEYWSGLPFPSPGDLPNPGTELLHWKQMLYRLSHQGSTTRDQTHWPLQQKCGVLTTGLPGKPLKLLISHENLKSHENSRCQGGRDWMKKLCPPELVKTRHQGGRYQKKELCPPGIG